MLLYIQTILNNISFSTISKTFNKIAYSFSLCKPLNLFIYPEFPNTFQVCIDVANAIFLAFSNKKLYYNQKY